MPDGAPTFKLDPLFWSGRLHTACMYAAEETKFGRHLSLDEIRNLEGAKHYIEIALKNDANNRGENAA